MGQGLCVYVSCMARYWFSAGRASFVALTGLAEVCNQCGNQAKVKEMLSVRLVKHALRMITGNLSQALKVSVGPSLILIATFAVIFGVGGLGDPETLTAPPLLMVMMFFIAFPVTLFVFGWIAVSWHRFILLEEHSGMLPAYRGRPIWPYLWVLFVLGLRMFVVIIPFMFILGGLFGNGSPAVFLFLILALNILLSYLAMRWALPLPAKAIGTEMRFSESWKATAPLGSTIFGVVVALIVFNFAVGFIGGVFAPLPIIGFIINVAVSWLTGMLGISILTTLYGHIVEGRDLP